MRVLLLSRYTRLGASSRLRTMQYLSLLSNGGVEVDILPFFDDGYLHALYRGRKYYTAFFKALLRRVRQVRRSSPPDLIWLEYEAFPWVPWLIENRILPRGIPIVSDYDDAVFHRYNQHPNRAVRRVLGSKIDHVMCASQLVIAGNAYVAAHARTAGAKRVEIVPTVLDVDRYKVRSSRHERDGQLHVGWIGTPTTWSAYGRAVFETLEPTLATRNARFTAIGANLTPSEQGLLDIRPWNERTEIEDIQTLDIGIMPLQDTPWARGKCGYKLIQYMACGLPVIASPVGVNAQIVEHGVNGFLASSEAEWREAVSRLLQDRELRNRMGLAGRRKVEQHFSLQNWGPRLVDLLRSCVRRPEAI